MAKVTFSLDDGTVATLRRTAERLRKPQSLVVREAIAHYAEREDRLSPEEQTRLLAVLDRYSKLLPDRSQADAEREKREIRRSRRLSSLRRPVR
jgi:hypothetical protein